MRREGPPWQGLRAGTGKELAGHFGTVRMSMPGFVVINGEHNRRTLSRILAQPIYRDALLMGKFLAALTALAVNLMGLWLLVVGLGVLLLGIPPSGEEFSRSLIFLVIAVGYAGVW